jgi:hypothetical protein
MMKIETVRLTNGEELYGIVDDKSELVLIYQYRWSEYYRRFNFMCQRMIPKQNILSIGM